MKELPGNICILLLLLCFEGIVAAQPRTGNNFFFQQLDNSSGLSNSAVNTVYQDNDHLLWVGTWDGLNMFDGTDFKVFNYTGNGSATGGSIGSNVIQDITEGNDGNIWVNTIGGITRIDKRSGRLYQYFYNNSSRRRISEREFDLAADTCGQVFCYSRTEGLNRFDSKTNTFRKVSFPDKNRRVIKMGIDDRQSLWLLLDNGELAVCRLNSGGNLKIQRIIRHRNGISNFFLPGGHVLIDSKGTLFRGDEQDRFRRITGSFEGIRALSRYGAHYLTVSDNQGLKVYDDRFRPSSFMKDETERLSGIKVTSLMASKEGILWLGTDGNGLIRISPAKNYFGLVNRTSGYGPDKPVRAFCEVDGELWVGTKGQGIMRLAGFGSDHISPSFLDRSAGLTNNSVFALRKGPGPYVYIGTDGAGLDLYDIQKQKIIPWAGIKGTSGLPAFGSVYAILPDRDSSVWLGTSGSGLIHLRLQTTGSGEPEAARFTQYLSENTTGLANDIIYALAHTDDRHLWIACRYGGLSVLDKKTGVFKTFKAFTYPNSLSNNDILSLYCDDRKGLWIGTSFGLNYLGYREADKPEPVFIKYTTDDGLPNNTIHAIEQSAMGDIWLSTNRGLVKLKPETGIIITYNENDGLQSNEFSDGAVWKSPAGRLFFGGIYGFNYFFPQDIRSDGGQPNLLVSQLQIGGKNINENRLQVLKPLPDGTPGYTTEREMNFFRLTLKPIGFDNPVKNEFSYKLDGFDKNWNNPGLRGSIVYNSIPPGSYTLLVRWASDNGVWTRPIPVLQLRVEPYFWLSWPALLLYLALIITGGYLFHVYRKNKLEMKYQLEMEYQLRRKDESVHQQQLNFFTNIAHEIQTPLTLIMGSIEHFLTSRKSELLKNSENNYFLNLVHQHSVRLTYLVQQLLEFRKAEAGFLKKTDNYIDISKMLNSLTSLFMTESDKQGKPYIREIQGGIAGFTDKDKLEKILFNLLSNAFKHSAPGETVTFSATYTAEDELLCISVSNTGCKMTPEDVPLLFHKFYTKNGASYQKPSTGIGLSFAQELAGLLGSEIKAGLTGGTIRFTLCLPVKTTSERAGANEVVTSAPSYLYESLLADYTSPVSSGSGEENKNSLISELHDQVQYSILVVEDEPQLRFLLRQVLKEQYIVYEAANGTQALALLKKNSPDLIISDVMMPDMDGLELCREVKNTPATAQIPFIILSARGTEENKQEGYEVGADAYIPKPFNITYLMVRVRKLLDYHDRMRTLIKDQHIGNQFVNTDIADTDKEFLESILRVIENNLDEPELNATTIEDALAISKMQLYRKLKSLAGMTPAEFIKRVRLKHAADLLRNSQYTVSEIIYRTGFNSKSYFFREFKKIYQCAPNDYRAKHYEASLEDL